MKNTTMGVWVGTIVITIIIAFVVFFRDAEIETTKITNAEIQKSQAQQKLYEDDGSGVMVLHRGIVSDVKNGYLQWKKDYPERAQKVVAAAKTYENRFIVFYKTE